MNNEAHFGRALRILGLLEQIAGVAVVLITLSIMIPGFINVNPEMKAQARTGAVAVLAFGLAAGVFLFRVGAMLRRYNRLAWMATIAMCAMSAALNVAYFNVAGLIVPGIYLFYLLHPRSRDLVRRAPAGDPSPAS